MKLYNKLLLCTLIFVLMIPFASYAVDYIPGDVIVVLKPSDPGVIVTASDLEDFGTEAFRVASFAAESGAWVKNTYASISEAGNEVFALIHSDKKSTDELVEELMKNPEVVAASPNYRVYAAEVPNDPVLSGCWGMSFVKAYSAWDRAKGSDEIYVAIIDSGIDENNPDLKDNIALELGKNTRYKDNDSATDDYGHGTHVAGIIGAMGNNAMGIAGINWNVKMISVKALDSSGGGYIENVIDAVDYVTKLINQGVKIKVVNMSLETYLPEKPTHDVLVKSPLWRAFKNLDVLNKAVIVVAAGNQSQTIGKPSTKAHGYMVPGAGYYVYPPSFQGLYGMISVSATDKDGNLASFSNDGADISAPGVDILSTWIQESDSDTPTMRSKSGTSMAAPHISGAAALLASILPDSITAYQLKQIILGGGSDVSVSASSTGILNLKSALQYGETEASSIPAKSSEWAAYDDYNSYDADENNNDDYYEYDDDDDRYGACMGSGFDFFALMLLFPLVKKSLS